MSADANTHEPRNTLCWHQIKCIDKMRSFLAVCLFDTLRGSWIYVPSSLKASVCENSLRSEFTKLLFFSNTRSSWEELLLSFDSPLASQTALSEACFQSLLPQGANLGAQSTPSPLPFPSFEESLREGNHLLSFFLKCRRLDVMCR